MPYSLRGNSVVKSDSGEVVKTHPNREKALAHLRALKANVEETRLCECGAPARGLVCQRGHRLREAWSPEARAAALAARRGHSGGGGVAEATKRYEEIERRADKIAYLGTGKEEFPGGISVEGRGRGYGEHAVVTGADGKQTKVYSGRGGDAGHVVAAMSAASDHPDSPGGATRLSIDPRAAADSYATYTGLGHKSQIASGFKQRPAQELQQRGR